MLHARYEWDEAKNSTNFRKHGISFEDAIQTFKDPLYILRKDRIENGEQRWQALGVFEGTVLLLVAHTIREETVEGMSRDVIRIISARKADSRERYEYENENG